MSNRLTAAQASPVLVLAILYGVELLDELVYGLHGAVLPQMRDDLALSYTQVGLLFTIPGLVGLVSAPLIGLLGDTRHRRALVIGGIVATAMGLALVAAGQTFILLLLAFCVVYIASDAYVNLPQATLIDRDTSRAEKTMARWTLLGSLGVSIAPLMVAGLFYLGVGWRGSYWALAVIALGYTALLIKPRFDAHAGANAPAAPRELWDSLVTALKTPELIRWVVITELADLMLDKFLEMTGLYFHDVVGVDPGAASGAVAVLTVSGLIGNALLVPVLERVSGIKILRVTGLVVLAAFIALMLVPDQWVKLGLLAVIGFTTSSWFPVLRGRTYTVLPGKSGVIVSVTSLGSFIGVLVPVIVGRMADTFGLAWAMWLFVIGPLALLLGTKSK